MPHFHNCNGFCKNSTPHLDEIQIVSNEAQTGKRETWHMPKARLHKQSVWLRKVSGNVFSPFLFHLPVAVDQRCNQVEPIAGLDWRLVAAVLTSSLFALAAESFGDASLGAGALELATTMIQGLRVVGIRDLKDKSAKENWWA